MNEHSIVIGYDELIFQGTIRNGIYSGYINENNNVILELMLQYGLYLDKMEGNKTLKEMLESFGDNAMNEIVKKHYYR